MVITRKEFNHMKKKATKKTIAINYKEIRVDLDKLQEDVKNAYDTMRKILPKAVLSNREVKSFGNASHVILPKEYAKKKATIIISE